MEPYARPTNKQRDKLLEFTGDSFGFFLMQLSLKIMANYKPTENTSMSVYKNWVRASRLMFLHFPVQYVHEELNQVYYDYSNDVWFNKEWFDFETKETIKKETIKIDGKVNIVDVARRYGSKVKGNMAICPFHDDKDPSLSLSPEKNMFNCFGCEAKGDIITFYKKLKEMKNEKN